MPRYICRDDVYVLPSDQMPHDTTLDLNSSRIDDYKNAWCVLEGVDPTSSKEMDEYRKRKSDQSISYPRANPAAVYPPR